jgi:hypothetical protein
MKCMRVLQTLCRRVSGVLPHGSGDVFAKSSKSVFKRQAAICAQRVLQTAFAPSIGNQSSRAELTRDPTLHKTLPDRPFVQLMPFALFMSHSFW